MVAITSLVLPIVLSAVFVFIASSLIHMVLGYHRSDYTRLPDEDKVLAALRSPDLKPALYTLPYCTHKDMKSPEIQEKFKQGPVGMLTVFPTGRPNMLKFLGLWFVYCLLIGFFTAYLTGRTVLPGGTIRRCFGSQVRWPSWLTGSARW